MILRRVTNHLRQQHWIAVFLDFLIVVLGVFIGIQVSNWNAAREDALLGQDYVRRLVIDLNKDLTVTDREIAYYSAVLKAVNQAADLLQEPDPDPKALVAAVYRGTETLYLTPNRATWDQIVSSGNLGLLPKDAVSGGLSAHYSFVGQTEIFNRLNNSEYRKAVRSIVPIKLQKAIRAGCSDTTDKKGVVSGLTTNCKIGADPDLLRTTAQILKNDPEVLAALRYQYSDVTSLVFGFKINRAYIESALKALGAPEESQGAHGL